MLDTTFVFDVLVVLGANVEAAKGGMFNDLEEVARHLQRNGIKIDTPNDPKMAEVLGKYGVLNQPIGKRMISHSFYLSADRKFLNSN